MQVPLEVFHGIWRHELAPIDTFDSWCVWQGLGSEIAVNVGRSPVALRTGYVLAALRMRCDEAGESELVVPLATGTETEGHLTAGPTGLVMTAEATARGDLLLVDVWGDVAVSACWPLWSGSRGPLRRPPATTAPAVH